MGVKCPFGFVFFHMQEKKMPIRRKDKEFSSEGNSFLVLTKKNKNILYLFYTSVTVFTWGGNFKTAFNCLVFIFFVKMENFFFSQFPSGLAPSLLSMGANPLCAGAEGGAPVRTIIKNQWRLTKTCICIVYVDRCAASAYIYNTITFFMAELHKIQHSRWHHITPCTPAFIERHHH